MMFDAQKQIAPAELGARLAIARRNKNLSQEEVASKLGVSRPTYVSIEKGSRKAKPAELDLLSKLYNRSVHELSSQREFIADFAPHLASACKIVGSSSDAALLKRCEAAIQQAVGTQATAVRSQTYYLDITPPGHDKGTFIEAIAKRLGISTGAVATIGDMQNDLAMFRKSGLSFAMGNATDDVKRQAAYVTASNEDEGFAKAIDMILTGNENRS